MKDLKVSLKFRSAIAESIRKSRYTREEIVALLYGMTGLKISKSILDQMTAASKVQYRFPAEILPALCEVTQDFEPLRILAESCGFEMVDQQDARKLKIMRLEEEKRNIEEEIERLKGEADE
jgi:hypothetical protein